MLSAIIVAGGSSVRAGFDKLFAPLHGKPVVAHALAAFHDCAEVSEIIIVGRAERLQELRGLTSAAVAKPTRVIVGGVRRQDSVAAGLAAVSSAMRFVAVHDAARPMITPAMIAAVYAAAQTRGAATAAAPVVDTLKRGNAGGMVNGSVERDSLYAMQTPQIFRRELLERAYAAVAADSATITDEVSAVERLGEPVMLVSTSDFNFKVTYAADLHLAECVMRTRA